MRIIEVFDTSIMDDVAPAVVTNYETAKAFVKALVNSITPDDADPGYEIQIALELYNTTQFKSKFTLRDLNLAKERTSVLNFLHTDVANFILKNYTDLEADGLAVTNEEAFKQLWISKL